MSASRAWPAAVVALVALGVGGCSSDSAGTAASESVPVLPTAPAECTAGAPVVKADRIQDAIAAVESERGPGQQFFEINATSLLVNLFVADTAAGQVVPYVWVDGALTHDAGSSAQGNTFAASALDFDPQKVVSCVVAQLPGSSIDAFVIEGGPEGAVRYTVITTSAQGGQLVVQVAGDGSVIAVDPN